MATNNKICLASNVEEVTSYNPPSTIPSVKKKVYRNGYPVCPDKETTNLFGDNDDDDDEDVDNDIDIDVDATEEESEEEIIAPMRSSGRGRKVKQVSYIESSSEEDNDEEAEMEDEDEMEDNESIQSESDGTIQQEQDEEQDKEEEEEEKKEDPTSRRKRIKTTAQSTATKKRSSSSSSSSRPIRSNTITNATKESLKQASTKKSTDIRGFFSQSSSTTSKKKSSTSTKRTLRNIISTSSGKKKKVANSKKATSSTRTTTKRKRKDSDDVYIIDSDNEEGNDDDEEMESFANEEEESVQDFDHDDEESDFEESKPKSKRKSQTLKKSTAKPKSKKKKGKSSMVNDFKPTNTPVYQRLSLDQIKKEKEFLDPCGMEATDNIVDRLIAEQLEKVGGLLLRSMENGGYGSDANLIKLGTACSGTDAPALALTLIQEQMELMGLGQKSIDDHHKNKKRLEFSHEFSCEVDPFKQAYLARNFDSELYPDIAKLTNDPPVDVYGKEVELPEFNMFVAGTSCKNFSMMIAKFRKDIEDKGCSGETFMAACEVLFDKKPPIAIFENVQGAPWLKMQEYITGRVKLANCDEKKQITYSNKSITDLSFNYENGKILVSEVPGWYGVRAGAPVMGYLECQSNDLTEIKWPDELKKKKTCTLDDLFKYTDMCKETDTIVFKTPVTYCTHLLSVDTKDFGLPQTRQRKYLFVWQPENGDPNDDLGYYWEAIVDSLKSPVRHSLEAFLLSDNHENIRRFREALNGPPGRKTKIATFQEPDFWKSANANLPHNKSARKLMGMEDRARPQTSWGPFGQKQVPPHWWLEYINCNYQRIIDLLDILHIAGLRDAEGHDSNFASFYWNISQNATREKHRSAHAGIAGCITPGGDFFIPHKGRPLLGCEKLLLQGLPYFRLLLGNESEVQLGDLAGNAMSLTVVSACMLGAITCQQLRAEASNEVGGKAKKENDHQERQKKEIDKFVIMMKPIIEEVAPLEKEFTSTRNNVSTMEVAPCLSFSSCVNEILNSVAKLATDAIQSSIWCTCESSGRNSLTNKFVRCKICRVSCCRNCISGTAGYQLKTHSTEEITMDVQSHEQGTFYSKMQRLLPEALYLTKEGLVEADGIMNGLLKKHHRISLLTDKIFYRNKIYREKKKWISLYYAKESSDAEEYIGEVRMTIGELKDLDLTSFESQDEVGLRLDVTSYIPARVKPFQFGKLHPCISRTITLAPDGSIQCKPWKANSKPKRVSLTIEGLNVTESPRVKAGLTDSAAKMLKNATEKKNIIKSYESACARKEQSRWIYASNWKDYPSVIKISGEGSISGTYDLAECEQTTNMSSLWIRESKAGEPRLYILIQPDVHRTGPDAAIISTSINHEDSTSIVASLPIDWTPSNALLKSKRTVDNVLIHQWVDLNSFECRSPKFNIEVVSPENSQRMAQTLLLTVKGLSEGNITTLCSDIDPVEDKVELPLLSGHKASQIERYFKNICVNPIQKHIAEGKLNFALGPTAEWNILASPKKGGASYGCCPLHVPKKPLEHWYYDKDRSNMNRYFDKKGAREFYQAVVDAPKPFKFIVDKRTSELQVTFCPEVAAHQVAKQLIHDRGVDPSEVGIQYRFMDTTLQSDPVITPFIVKSCANEMSTNITLKHPYKLYERQKKVITKMINIEKNQTKFDECEMIEYALPGSLDISMIFQANRKANLRGGVVADAIGAGKTVVSIGIILEGLEEARSKRIIPHKSSATLVLMPPALLKQWSNEIKKFTPDEYKIKIIIIYDFDTLKGLNAEKIACADVILAPIDIIESKGYIENLLKIAKESVRHDKYKLKLPTHSGQKELNGARGLWIPSSSADPYGGTNNNSNQTNRNQSAYFTFVYKKSIYKIRKEDLIKSSTKGVPLEFFEFERVIIDECHETLCSSKFDIDEAKEKDKANFFKEKNRRAGRELLGLTIKDPKRRPLVCRGAFFGLTGTPLLDSTERVIELANLMCNTHVIGLYNHWRKLEKESSQEIFLDNFLEQKQGREIRKVIFEKCQEYLDIACCRNKTGEEMNGIELVTHHDTVQMGEDEQDLYIKSQKGIPQNRQNLSITPEDFEDAVISPFLKQNACLKSRGEALVKIVKGILSNDKNSKIIVFTDGRCHAGIAACKFLNADPEIGGCTSLSVDDNNKRKTEKISWYQNADATEEDRKRPRVLVLHFEHCAGLNLQSECNHMILFAPLYTGDGGPNNDTVADASTELQAIGRVYRAGQKKNKVHLFKIIVEGPKGEELLDGQILRRNTDKDTVAMAVNASD